MKPDIRPSEAKSMMVINKTLVFVRWLAVIGQSLALVITELVLNISIPLFPASICIFLSVLVNVYAQITFGNRTLGVTHAMAFMIFDVIQLTAILSLTGGLTNPFSVLLLGPAAVGATLLPLAYTISLIVLAIFCVSFLAYFSIPLQWNDIGTHDFPALFTAGEIIAMTLALAFICLYIWRISSESRSLSRAYEITQLALARQQASASLGALSAATAHELGSPLSTISLISSDLSQQLAKDPQSPISMFSKDIKLLKNQINKSRDLLKDLGNIETQKSVRDLDSLRIDVLVKSLAEPYQHRHPEIKLNVSLINHEKTGNNQRDPGLFVKKTPVLDFGIGNIIQNAFKFARTKVDIVIQTYDKTIQIEIKDDGPGFSNAVLRDIGEPHVASLGGGIAMSSDNFADIYPQEGLGLGIFIAQTLLEIYNAQLFLTNQPDKKGALVKIAFNKKDLEI